MLRKEESFPLLEKRQYAPTLQFSAMQIMRFPSRGDSDVIVSQMRGSPSLRSLQVRLLSRHSFEVSVHIILVIVFDIA
jgi:hypothetical protein